MLAAVISLVAIGITHGREVQFENVTDAAGLSGAGGRAAWADFDNDGDVDLMSGSTLYRNNGDGTFAKSEIGAGGPGIWGDANNDGYLDFYRHNGRGELQLAQEDGRFRRDASFAENPIQLSESAAWADANGDGFLDLYVANYERSMHPQPDFYVESTVNGGYLKPVTWRTAQNWSARGVNWADFDNDGDQDLYISNYRLMPNNLFVNDGSGRFTDEAWDRGVAGTDLGGGRESPAYIYTGHTIGSCWGDLNNDGNLDLVVVNFSHPPKFQNRPQVLINSGPPDYKFTNVNKDAGAGIYWQESYAKGALGDFDNDGDLDLYMTTVYSGDQGELFENDGTGHFKGVGDRMNVRVATTYVVAWADYDNDGDLDLHVGGRLFRNLRDSTNSWIKVKVVGDAGSNRAAIGARVRVTAGPLVQVREVCGGNSGNQNPLITQFGLNTYEKEVKIEVYFPSGKYGMWTVKPRRAIVARESEATSRLKAPRK